MNHQTIYDAGGVARYVGKSESWGHTAFARGMVPTEVMLNGRRACITEATLKRMAPALRLRKKRMPSKRPN